MSRLALRRFIRDRLDFAALVVIVAVAPGSAALLERRTTDMLGIRERVTNTAWIRSAAPRHGDEAAAGTRCGSSDRIHPIA